MQSTITTILLLFVTPFIAKSQNNYFTNPTTEWYGSQEIVKQIGDTLINGETYSKLNLARNNQFQNPEYVGAMRFDSVENKVFFVVANNTIEQLAYDFSAQIDDTVITVPIWNIDSDPVRNRVVATDSVLINGNYHQRLQVEGIDQQTGMVEYWTEGIGSSFGILQPGINGKIIFDVAYPFLKCVFADGQEVFHLNTATDCAIQTSIGLSENTTIALDVFPNPTHSNLIVRSEHLIQKVVISNPNGQIFPTTVQFVGDNEFHITTTELSTGYYFLLVTTGNQQQTIPFSKQ